MPSSQGLVEWNGPLHNTLPFNFKPSVGGRLCLQPVFSTVKFYAQWLSATEYGNRRLLIILVVDKDEEVLSYWWMNWLVEITKSSVSESFYSEAFVHPCGYIWETESGLGLGISCVTTIRQAMQADCNKMGPQHQVLGHLSRKAIKCGCLSLSWNNKIKPNEVRFKPVMVLS